MEMLAQTINLLNGHDVNNSQVDNGQIQTHIQCDLSPLLINSSGVPWTANYVTVTGDLVTDLLSTIATEQRSKVVYEYLYSQIDDKEVRATIDFLLNRTEVHNTLFEKTINKVQRSDSSKDFGITKDSKLYFDLSSPGPKHEAPNPTPPSFDNPRK